MRKELIPFAIILLVSLILPMVIAFEKWTIPVTADIELRSGEKVAESFVDCYNNMSIAVNFKNTGTVELTAKLKADVFDSDSNLIDSFSTGEQNVTVGDSTIFNIDSSLPTTPGYAILTVTFDHVDRGLNPSSPNITQTETLEVSCAE